MNHLNNCRHGLELSLPLCDRELGTGEDLMERGMDGNPGG